MSDSRQRLGAFGEREARDYLLKRGYEILESNFRCPIGEIDIVARDGDFLVFVEVRTRRGSEFGTPEESITQAKKGKLVHLAQYYIQQHAGLPASWRIDVVAIEVGRNGKISRIELIENAVD
ncbi:MAG: YraN family protein [Dehalococcoidia bacterium]|nr:YraN family protein [Dehalococcoidia bacterium]